MRLVTAARPEPRHKVSVVIPAYGRTATLPRAIDSVRAQRDVDVEILVVDDHSPEPLRLPEGAYDDIRVLRTAENMGAGPARNHGVAEASHDIVAFLDADDEWLSGT